VGVLSGIGASWTQLDPLSVMPIQESWKLLARDSGSGGKSENPTRRHGEDRKART